MAFAGPEVLVPAQPALVVGIQSCAWLNSTGEKETIDIRTAQGRISNGVIPIVCHSRATARRLNFSPFPTLDILELFAFVNPAQFALPTPLGIAEALGLPLPNSQENAAETLIKAAHALLANLATLDQINKDTVAIATAMTKAGWPWGPSILATLGIPDGVHSNNARHGLKVWTKLPEWQEIASERSPNNQIVSSADVLKRLVALLGVGAEKRQGQLDFAKTCTVAFQPRNKLGEPHLVLAEAGTGVGKTMGYVAPASIWAERNDGTVWISTYTRNLQRQVDTELSRLWPTPFEKESRVVIRKGRENYLCLLNLADAVGRQSSRTASDTVALGLISRWANATRDGDMRGGDFPAWLIDLLGTRLTIDLTDTLGECIYSACDHYRKCFIERNIRRAETADIVIANHALVIIQASMNDSEESTLPLRYVFDEGHHLFDAADAAFSMRLTGTETSNLRLWLLGPDRGRGGIRQRGRGLLDRAKDLVSGDDHATGLLSEIIRAAQALPDKGWEQRISVGEPIGPTEVFLGFVRQQVYARDKNAHGLYDIETETKSPVDGLVDAAAYLGNALKRLEIPLGKLSKWLLIRLDKDAKHIDSTTRARMDGLSKSIVNRCSEPLIAWQSMLDGLVSLKSDLFVDWFGVSRTNGRDADVGYFRHWLDPTKPLAKSVFEKAHGLVVTSASLRDHNVEKTDDGWTSAYARVGGNHIKCKSLRASHPSPFRYKEKTRVLIVRDVERNNPDQVASAYRELFLASGGGGIGLFTAINRLRAVHKRIAKPLEGANIPLLAQHVDSLDTGTLVDIFRAEENSCLLGTDALRDGVDVPGRSLRLIVFDRVPWPRPTILHKARKNEFGGQAYDDMLTRLKLKQAFGRLLRRDDDKGVLVMLDRSLPTRLLSAFPSGVKSERIGLSEALKTIRAFTN